MNADVEYRAIGAHETRLLRCSVLHPDRDGDAILFSSDSDPCALHVGAFAAGALVGVGSAWPAALPDSRHSDAWRIVGMAVEATFRGRGIGSEILGRLLTHAASQDSKLAWCNSRENAVPLYRRYGFTTTPPRDLRASDGVRVRMTCRLDRSAPIRREVSESGGGIRRIDSFPRLSRAVIHNNAVHIGGLLPNRSDVSVGEQTREILEKIETLLHRAGSSKSKLISAMVWLKDIAAAAEANAVWESWVPTGTAPARSCVQAVPGSPEFDVEIAVVAAQ
jgi:enamine deaminase RidA (YjgF/YER057c/UK114 family)